MNSLKTHSRSLLKKRNHNLLKILSLGVGLALGLVLIASVCFERSYNDFFPDNERIYQLISNYSSSEGSMVYPQTPGAVAAGMKTELPEVEAATRFTWLARDAVMVTPDKKKYSGNMILADSCLFDIFPRPLLAGGEAKEILARPMHVMIARKIAEKMGGADRAVGQTFMLDAWPGLTLAVGGVFEDIPPNSHLTYDVAISLPSIGRFMHDGSMNWVGNDRYMAYVKLFPGTRPEALAPGIEKMKEKYLPLEELEKSGFRIGWDFKPLRQIHTGEEDTKRMLLILSLLAAALLLTATMNYALIVISSLVNRSREMAVHKCYGASAGAIYRKVFLETSLDLALSLAAAAALVIFFRGAVLSLLGAEVSRLFTLKSLLPLTAVCLFVFGAAALIPGYLYARIPVAAAFRHFAENKRYWKLGLLFIQFVAAALFLTLPVIIERQYSFMLDKDPGYAYQNLAYCSLAGVDPASRQKALDETGRLPGVAEVSACSQLFFYSPSGNNIQLPGDPRELFNIADLYQSGNGYLNLMEIPVIEGRSFLENQPSSSEVMVSRRFADKMANYADWPDGAAGKQIYITEHSRGLSDLYTICGVYEDVQLGVIGDIDARPSVMFYSDRPGQYLMIKFHKLTPEIIQEVSALLTELLPDKHIEVYSYAAQLKDRYADSEKFRDSALAGGLVTLLICLAGLTGYTSDEMNRRKKETAIRKVNGATTGAILRLYAGGISRAAIPAVALGCLGAYFIADTWLRRFTEKAALTPFLFAGCALTVLIIILATVCINCLRAANENPAKNLKSE
jgi:putative ABC transport system permease protein